MNNRAYTFCAYNPETLPFDCYFLVRAVTRMGGHLESRPERAWNERKLHELAMQKDIWELVDDPEYPLVPPQNVELGIGERSKNIGPSDGPTYDPDLTKLLGLGSLPYDEGGLRIKEGKQRLALQPHRSKGRDSGLFRLLGRRNEWPFLKGGAGVLRSAPFRLESGDAHTCIVRIECPPNRVAILHIEQWRVGTDGDRDRPMGELTFVFVGSEQIAANLKKKPD